MILTRNFKYIMGSLVCLLVSISLMLGIFITFTQGEVSLELILQSQISLEEGSYYDINYEVNIKEAEISFVVADTRVAKVEDNKIIAVGAGNTILRATASYKDKIIHSNCKIIVSEQKKKFYYYIQTLENCTYNNESLTVSDSATFLLNVFDSENRPVDSSKITFSGSEGIEIERQFDYFLVTAQTDGQVYFEIKELEFSFIIDVKKRSE